MKDSKKKKSAWHQFLSNPFGKYPLAFLSFLTLMAVFAYVFIPDKSPHANTQYLELSTLAPATRVVFIQVNCNPEKRSFSWTELFTGRKNNCTRIPVAKYAIDSLNHIISFIPYNQSDGVWKTLKSNQATIISKNYWLGTDQFGRDLFSRLVLGARVSLSVGFISVIISLIIGIPMGTIGGYFRSWIDEWVMWLINVVWAIPSLLLVIAISFALGKGFWQVFVAVGFTMWVEVARITRGQVISLREKEYVEAAKAMGFSHFRIIFRHILPNIINPLIVISTANFASAILIEAGLSFLGLGVQPPVPSWGSMIREYYGYIILDAAYLALAPGIAISLVVMALMLIGQALRDALNVRN